MVYRVGWIGLVLFGILGCSSEASDQADWVDEPGSIQLSLTTRGLRGDVYRLAPASFSILREGATDPTQVVEASADVSVLDVPVTPGNYTVTLSPGWVLNEVRADNSLSPLPATLLEEPVKSVTVADRKTTPVTYRFSADRSQIALGVTVEERSPEYVEYDGDLMMERTGVVSIYFWNGGKVCCFSSVDAAQSAYPGLKLSTLRLDYY